MTRFILFATTAFLAVCSAGSGQATVASAIVSSAATQGTPQASPRAAEVPNSAEFARFFEAYEQAKLAIISAGKDQMDAEWAGDNDRIKVAQHDLAVTTLANMRTRFDRSKLPSEDQLSYDLFEAMMDSNIALHAFRRNAFVFGRDNGRHKELPDYLISKQVVKTADDAEAYVSRLQRLDAALDTHIAEAKAREKSGVVPPKWVIPTILADAKKVITGAPFDDGPDSRLFADFKSKVGRLDIGESEKARLIEASRLALLGHVKPAYQRLISLMETQQKSPAAQDGIWRFKDGAEHYAALVRSFTTTDMTPEQIHQLGLQQVARIHKEMRGIMARVGFTGTLQQFFERMRTDRQFYLPDTEEGRQAYLERTELFRRQMEAQLPEWFATLPKAPMVVKPYRDKPGGGMAHYEVGSADGKSPGIYYVNLSVMDNMPTTLMEDVLYHEGLPGHHLQRSLQTELDTRVPRFRRVGKFPAYTEGWGFYAERLAKDMGFYTDPYSDFGRLQGELHRAMRLVVDTGLHHKRWTREQGIKYIEENGADPKGSIPKMVEAYILSPGQGTSYMIGKLKIEELRERARIQLGSRFDIKGLHDAVLLTGPVPLEILERNVNAWIASRKG